MGYDEIVRIREEIEGWVRLIGKRRVEKLLKISIYDLEDRKIYSAVYE